GAGLVAGLLAVVAPAQAATGLTASFHVDSTWQGAYQGTYTITNNTAGTVTGWNVQFDLPSGSSIGNWWNANLTTSGQHVTAVSGTSATVDGLSANTTYSFTVVAKDGAENVSKPSTAVSAKTLACTSNCGGGTTLRVAPYIDMGQYPTPLLSTVSKASTLKSFTLAFIIAGGNACKASWFGAFD